MADTANARERSRLDALRRIDFEQARPTFDRLCGLVRRATGAPFAFIGLLEEDQVWLAGVERSGAHLVARDISLSTIAIENEQPMWIENAALDPRCAHNPNVVGDPKIRFFAASPIRLSSGEVIGALMLLDRAPRAFDAQVASDLDDFAAIVVSELEQRLGLQAQIQRETEARQLNEFLATAIRAAPVALVMTDRHMRVVQTSDRWLREMAFDASSDVIGKTIYELFPEAEARWTSAYEHCLEGNSIGSEQMQMTLADGRRPWLRTEMTPWRNPRGDVGGLLIMTCDITDVVGALEDAKRSEQRLSMAAELASLSVWEMDYRRRELSAGGARPVTDDESSYDDLDRDIWATVHPDDRDEAQRRWDDYMETGAPYRMAYRLTQKGGPPIWVDSACEAIRNSQGKITRILGVMRNIDAEKQAEEELLKAKDAAEAANLAKSEFLANMSHEIRTPLNGVMGVAGALAKTRLDPDQSEMVGLIETSAQTLEALLTDILDLARIEAGRLEIKPEPFDFAASVKACASLFEATAQAKQLSFETDISPAAQGAFLGDAARLRQVICNLLSNAIKFTEAGSVRVSVEATPQSEATRLKVSVADSGIGFDAETKARLFDRFEQADGSITRRFGGTGLGLAISHSLIAAMGGELTADAEPGQGATFSFEVTLARTEAVEAAADSATESSDIGSLRVLLAEDHPTNRRVVELILGAAGVDLMAVENGEEAVAAAALGGFDLILMDMQMPVMDGLTAIRHIRAAERQTGRRPTPILTLTANAMPEHAAASHAAGADGHVTKPITADALLDAVADAVLNDAAEQAKAAVA